MKSKSEQLKLLLEGLGATAELMRAFYDELTKTGLRTNKQGV